MATILESDTGRNNTGYYERNVQHDKYTEKSMVYLIDETRFVLWAK